MEKNPVILFSRTTTSEDWDHMVLALCDLKAISVNEFIGLFVQQIQIVILFSFRSVITSNYTSRTMGKVTLRSVSFWDRLKFGCIKVQYLQKLLPSTASVGCDQSFHA